MSGGGYEQESGRDRFFDLLSEEMAVLLDPSTGRMREELAERVACVVCGEREADPWFHKEGLDFVRCGRCGLVYMNPRPSAQALERLYQFESAANDAWVDVLLSDAEERFQTRDFSALLDHVAGVRATGRLLDVGCSIGRLPRIARERGYDVLGLELGERAARHARDVYGLPVREELLEACAFDPGSFDVVTLIETLEHVPDPRAMLVEIHRILSPGGAFLVGVPNVASLGVLVLQGRARTFNRNHLVYFDARTLARLLEEVGFEVVRVLTAVSVLDSVLNHVQGFDPFGAPRSDRLPPELARRLALPEERARMDHWIEEAGLGYRLRVLARKAE
ncbi:MAG: class I SAM-dependent methyltransferase [Gemmatimonadota bacterium]